MEPQPKSPWNESLCFGIVSFAAWIAAHVNVSWCDKAHLTGTPNLGIARSMVGPALELPNIGANSSVLLVLCTDMYSIFQTRPQSLALHPQGINGATAMQLPKALGKPAVLPRPMQPQGRSANSFCCALDCSILPRPISSNSIKSSMVLAGSAKTLGKVSLVFPKQSPWVWFTLPQKCRNSVVYHGVLPHEWQAKQKEVESQVTAVVAAPATAPPVFSTARACQTFAALDVWPTSFNIIQFLNQDF